MTQERGALRLNSGAYVLAIWIARLPSLVLFSLVASGIVTLISAFNGFTVILASTFLSLLTSDAIAASIAIVELPESMVSSLFFFLLLCQGFLVTPPDIPPWLVWGYHISFPSYAFRAMFIHELTHSDNQTELQEYGLTEESVGFDLAILAGFAVGFQIVHALLLRIER